MAIPAVIILEKYPSCILGRREVFRRPWDSVVRPEELLTLGEKLFLVPRRTVRKLRWRVKKPDGHREVSSNSFASKSCVDVCVDKVSSKSNDFPSTSFCQQSEATVYAEKTASERKSAVKRRVRFVGIEEKDSHLEEIPGIRAWILGLMKQRGGQEMQQQHHGDHHLWQSVKRNDE